MKKSTFKITRGLKGLLLAGAITVASLFAHGRTASHTIRAFAPFGLVAGMKKKGITLSEDEEKSMKAIEDEMNAFFTEHQKGLISSEDLDRKLGEKEELMKKAMASNEEFSELKKKFETLDEANRKQAETITSLKNDQKALLPDQKTIATAIKSFLDENKENFEAFRKGQVKSFGTDKSGFAAIELESKAAATMTIAGSTGSSGFVPNVQVMPGFVDLSRNRPFLEQFANTSTTNSSRIVWTEKYNPQGQAGFIAEGAVKPLISFEIRTAESYAKKVADKIKVSTEMLDDIDFMAAEIENELKYQVDIKTDASLLAGAGDGTQSATDMKGLTAYVSGYVLTTVLTDSPNNMDAVRAAIAQVASLNFTPNALFINPIDGANMDLTKDANGRPIMKEYTDANGRVFMLQPIETNQMPVGYFLVGDMSRFKVRNYKPFAIYFGWVNDDFEKNLITVIGERRLHAFVATNEVGAFVYDRFSTVKTAITKP